MANFSDIANHSRASTATYVDSDGVLQTAAINEPRIGHHVWDGSEWVNKGILHESESRTNLLLNSDDLETQVVTVTPDEPHTISFVSGSHVVDIDETIASTAVDVFIYDTSKDSDGGAWRTGALAQASSWYNETLNTATRGSRREFPAVAVIVAEADTVTIYDGDDPALPMWMVFELGIFRSSSRSGAFALNGQMAISDSGLSGTLTIVRFIDDSALRHRAVATTNGTQGLYLGNISTRNVVDVKYDDNPDAAGRIINETTNDVAMTVLDDAPTDPATGLKTVTIAVATDGGVSVIKDDGTVVDSAESLATDVVFFDSSNGLWYRGPGRYSYAETTDFEAGDGFGSIVAATTAGSKSFDLLSAGTQAVSNDYLALGGAGNSASAVPGLMLHQPNYTDQPKGMSAFLTSTYNTGWMNGDIKGAFLSDTDDTDLVGSGELVTNGTFDTDLTGWTDLSVGTGSVSQSSGEAVVERIDGSNQGILTQGFSTTVGETYVLTLDKSGDLGTIRIGTTSDGSQIDAFIPDDAVFKTFVAQSTTTYVTLRGGTNPATVNYDNVSVKLADADRSVNNNGLIVNGTVTRTPVATGADLVAYSGFSGSNYLEGTDASYVDTLYAIGWEQTSGVWEFKHGVVSTAPIDGLTITTNTLKIQGTKPKALIRLSATTPSSTQLEKIEDDEKVLFQENAQATLYGASNAVAALAHDPDTDLLHVGTSAGRSVFSGLRRINNTTTGVTTAISAANGVIGEQ